MTDMVEKVARAINPAAFRNFELFRDYCVRKGDSEEDAVKTAKWAHGREVDRAMSHARAAIEAMMHPTGEMIDAAARSFSDVSSAEMLWAWQSAIDAALSNTRRKDNG